MQCAYDPDDVTTTWAQFNQMYWNGFVSQHEYELWRKLSCDSEDHRKGMPFPKCDEILQRVTKPEILGVDYNSDDLYSDYCTNNGTLDFATNSCADDSGTVWNIMTNYLSQDIVSRNFHADYNFNANYNSFDFTTDVSVMVPYYAKILAKMPSVKILVYSGLSDVGTVPFTASMPCLHQLSEMTRSKVLIFILFPFIVSLISNINANTKLTNKNYFFSIIIFVIVIIIITITIINIMLVKTGAVIISDKIPFADY
jgi:hypothetical protein